MFNKKIKIYVFNDWRLPVTGRRQFTFREALIWHGNGQAFLLPESARFPDFYK